MVNYWHILYVDSSHFYTWSVISFKSKVQADQQDFLSQMFGGLTDDIVKQVLKMNENR